MLLLSAEALFLSLLCYCSWLLNGSVFFFLWKLKHLQADSGVTRYSQKMFVVPQELVCHLVFQKFPRNSSKTEDPFWAKICMNTSVQLLVYIMKVKSQEEQKFSSLKFVKTPNYFGIGDRVLQFSSFHHERW